VSDGKNGALNVESEVVPGNDLKFEVEPGVHYVMNGKLAAGLRVVYPAFDSSGPLDLMSLNLKVLDYVLLTHRNRGVDGVLNFHPDFTRVFISPNSEDNFDLRILTSDAGARSFKTVAGPPLRECLDSNPQVLSNYSLLVESKLRSLEEAVGLPPSPVVDVEPAQVQVAGLAPISDVVKPAEVGVDVPKQAKALAVKRKPSAQYKYTEQAALFKKLLEGKSEPGFFDKVSSYAKGFYSRSKAFVSDNKRWVRSSLLLGAASAAIVGYVYFSNNSANKVSSVISSEGAGRQVVSQGSDATLLTNLRSSDIFLPPEPKTVESVTLGSMQVSADKIRNLSEADVLRAAREKGLTGIAYLLVEKSVAQEQLYADRVMHALASLSNKEGDHTWLFKKDAAWEEAHLHNPALVNSKLNNKYMPEDAKLLYSNLRRMIGDPLLNGNSSSGSRNGSVHVGSSGGLESVVESELRSPEHSSPEYFASSNGSFKQSGASGKVYSGQERILRDEMLRTLISDGTLVKGVSYYNGKTRMHYNHAALKEFADAYGIKASTVERLIRKNKHYLA
jgi:hypothetical protein